MDLRSFAAGAITTINPDTPATLYKSSGYTTGLQGKQTPTYATPIAGLINVQALTGQEIQHLNNLNITGVTHKVYLSGDWQSIVRSTMRGGDKFVFSYGDLTNATWLVATVMETWPDWCCVAVELQVKP